MLALGVGQMRLAPSELYEMELGEFLTAYSGYIHAENMRQRFELERTRLGAATIVMPWLENRPTLQQLMPFPWEDIDTPAEEVVEITEEDIEARRQRAMELLNM